MKTTTIDQSLNRIQDLPEEEREPFIEWLQDQPLVPLKREEIKDIYDQEDYIYWRTLELRRTCVSALEYKTKFNQSGLSKLFFDMIMKKYPATDTNEQ